MIISERIFQMLKEKGLSQKEFSDRTGIAQSTISDWKRKKTNPAADKIMVICDVLEVSPYMLLTGSSRNVDYLVVDADSEEHFLLESFRTMEPDDRKRLMGYVEALKGAKEA
ncbi:MAG: helix-turn-helix transcriptional regulator [Lachnospiraceae bacterium]|nr:helix-turn-helix transcriptional regulator [Lachnospiraceae bacterium]